MFLKCKRPFLYKQSKSGGTCLTELFLWQRWGMRATRHIPKSSQILGIKLPNGIQGHLSLDFPYPLRYQKYHFLSFLLRIMGPGCWWKRGYERKVYWFLHPSSKCFEYLLCVRNCARGWGCSSEYKRRHKPYLKKAYELVEDVLTTI